MRETYSFTIVYVGNKYSFIVTYEGETIYQSKKLYNSEKECKSMAVLETMNQKSKKD